MIYVVTIVEILSLTILVLLSLACLSMAIGWTYEKVYEREDKFLRLRTDKLIAERFAQDCYWFSEDQPTYHLLKEYGENLHRVDTLREHWRANRKKFHQPSWTSVEVVSGPGYEFGVVSSLDGGRLVLVVRRTELVDGRDTPAWPSERKTPEPESCLVVQEGHEAFVIFADQNGGARV